MSVSLPQTYISTLPENRFYSSMGSFFVDTQAYISHVNQIFIQSQSASNGIKFIEEERKKLKKNRGNLDCDSENNQELAWLIKSTTLLARSTVYTQLSQLNIEKINQLNDPNYINIAYEVYKNETILGRVFNESKNKVSLIYTRTFFECVDRNESVRQKVSDFFNGLNFPYAIVRNVIFEYIFVSEKDINDETYKALREQEIKSRSRGCRITRDCATCIIC